MSLCRTHTKSGHQENKTYTPFNHLHLNQGKNFIVTCLEFDTTESILLPDYKTLKRKRKASQNFQTGY